MTKTIICCDCCGRETYGGAYRVAYRKVGDWCECNGEGENGK